MRKILFLNFIFLGFSCDAIIDVADISDSTVTSLAPSNDILLNVKDIIFSWDEIENADAYKLQIATPSFENVEQVVADTILSSSGFFKVLGLGDYQWRIKAKNANYETNFTTQNFTIE